MFLTLYFRVLMQCIVFILYPLAHAPFFQTFKKRQLILMHWFLHSIKLVHLDAKYIACFTQKFNTLSNELDPEPPQTLGIGSKIAKIKQCLKSVYIYSVCLSALSASERLKHLKFSL